MHRIFLLLGAAAGFLGVAMGAFGAWSARDFGRLSPRDFRTGVDYQMWHALALTLVGMMVKQFPARDSL